MPTQPTNISANNNNGSFTSGTSVTVSSTGNVPAGALMVIIISVGGASAPSGITATGWTTSLATTANGSGATVVTAIFTKIAPAPTASVSQSVSWTTTATNGHWLFTAWNGAGPSNLDGSVATTQNTSGTNTSPSITPSTGSVNDTLLCGFFAGATGTSTITQPAGMTSVFLAASSASQASFGVASLALASASATGSKTWTIGTSHINMGMSLLLQQGPAWGWTSSVDDRSQELIRVLNQPLMVPYK